MKRLSAFLFHRRWALAFAVLLTSGCGDGKTSDTYSVSGNITYDGKPLPRGNIMFSPDASANNKGPGAIAEIKDGKYQTLPEKGVTGGSYVLTINGYDGVPIPSGEGGMNEMGKPLFQSYDTKVDLPKEDTQHDIEVPKQK
ncbi:hypothetical protein C5Y96_21130 [Blastopirellula marina]|uniref:Carboxypeptidase regulatory-like domain-containing protein n=1 Tax=Blastopirellula marina TaxID=124 RepID=A0A2S8F1E1_9BACT|nr:MULTISPECIES: hypothetical protein [Pirellulaceae]PQO25959.1 hypothetical protein C5Y96_21130 [Blastopirellula marina]RCS44317.1 hypothetical protein DTL36_21175 [Bremerella cremea]